METPATITPAEKLEPKRDFGGDWITLGDRQYKLPALNFKSLKELMPKIAALGTMAKGATPTPEQTGIIIEVIHHALRRNYPDLAVTELEELVDMGNMFDAMGKVMGAAGLAQEKKGGGAGEV